MADEPFDTRFSLPSVDDPPDVEVGVILLGLGVERLLAGLGVAEATDDATAVTLRVDRLRHEAPGPADPAIDLIAAVAAGAARWRAARGALAAADPGGLRTAALRPLWAGATRTIAVVPELAELGPAQRAYLAACWLRRADVDRIAP